MRDCAFGVGPLAVMFRLRPRASPSRLLRSNEFIGRNEHVPFERETNGSRNLRIGSPQAPRHFHLNVIGDIEHAGNIVRAFCAASFFA